MTDSKKNAVTPPWAAAPTVKTKNGIQRSVTALLDELAPERVLKRAERLEGSVEQHRTPSGCVLQATSAAVSVSWYPDARDGAPLGELHIVVWNGTVTRLGTPRVAKGATVVSELVVRPVDPPDDACAWRDPDGTTFSTAGLVTKCLALLEAQAQR